MGRIIYTLLLVLAIAGTGCSSKKSGSGGGGNPGGVKFTGDDTVPPMTEPDDIIASGGEVIDLTITSKGALDAYVGGWTTNNPTEVKLIVNLTKQAEYTKSNGGVDYGFGGYVSIQFKDGSSTYKDSFSSLWLGESNCGWLGDCNKSGGNAENHKYNLLSVDYPETVGSLGFHGFFEDVRAQRLMAPLYGQTIFGGALILVIDSMNDAGDGQGPTSANGSVWFKNYTARYPQGPLPLTNCWFISDGPYDCRSWPSNGGVNTKLSIYPTNGYTKLGTFTGLDIQAAFNNEI